MKWPLGTPAVATMSRQEESLLGSTCWGWGLPRDGAQAGHDEAPARREDTGDPSLYPTRVCFRLPGQAQADGCDASTLGPEHPEVCSHVITRPYSPPQLAEPREDFLGAKPSNQALQSSDRWGPDAADLSAILGGQDG